MTNAPEIFNLQARGYDSSRRRLIPCFEAFYGTAVDAIGLGPPQPARILDLGAGTGLLSSFVHAAFPQAELALLDGAARMLEQARAHLGERVSYLERDLADPLPDGPWDAIVSALAIHHLGDDEKQRLFGRIRAELVEGGVFVNAEQVDGPTPALTDLYARWHEAQARRAGSDDAEWAAAQERMAYDRCSDVESQLAWMREVGLRDVDCLFKDHRFAVLVGLR